MTFKTLLLSVLLASLNFTNLYSQNKKISNVASVQLRNMGAILTDSEVSGYYMFYKTDKTSRKTYSYELQVLDQNLNNISTKSIEGPKSMVLLDGVYNNQGLMLKFYDLKEKEYTFRQYDKNANEISSTTKEISKIETMMLEMYANKKEGSNTSLFPIQNVGFLNYSMKKNKKQGYKIDFYTSSDDTESWSFGSNENSKEVEFATHIFSNKNIIVSSVMKKKTMMTKQARTSILALKSKTGEKLFDKEFTSPDYTLMVLGGFGEENSDRFYLYGNYFANGKNPFSNPSLGLFLYEVNMNGDIITEKFISWKDDVSKFLDVNEKGKLKNTGYVFFHKILRNADGNIYFIGEQYNKSYKGITTDLVVKDLMVFEFNKDFNLDNVNIINKQKTTNSAKGMALASPQVIALVLKQFGGFDYEFFQSNADKSIFSFGYVDYVKVKGNPNKYVFGSVTYTDSEPVTDKLDLMTVKEKKKIKVLPAKIGNIVVVEYNEKEKSLDMRIEKINY